MTLNGNINKRIYKLLIYKIIEFINILFYYPIYLPLYYNKYYSYMVITYFIQINRNNQLSFIFLV